MDLTVHLISIIKEIRVKTSDSERGGMWNEEEAKNERIYS
jgi:hypothetical protein